MAELDPLGITYADLHDKINKNLGSQLQENVKSHDIPREVVVRQHQHALGERAVLSRVDLSVL